MLSQKRGTDGGKIDTKVMALIKRRMDKWKGKTGLLGDEELEKMFVGALGSSSWRLLMRRRRRRRPRRKIESIIAGSDAKLATKQQGAASLVSKEEGFLGALNERVKEFRKARKGSTGKRGIIFNDQRLH